MLVLFVIFVSICSSNPTTYWWKGFFEFFCYESTQICKWNLCLLTDNATHYFLFITSLSSNIIYGFLLLNKTHIFTCWGKPNVFQYSFVTMHYFLFVIIGATLVQLVMSERNYKRNITVKNPFTNNCNTMVDPTKIFFQLNSCCKWRYVKQWIIPIFFLKYFIWEFTLCFPLLSYMIPCHILRKFKPVVCFKIGCNFIFKMISNNLSPTKKNGYDNEQNTQTILISWKT